MRRLGTCWMLTALLVLSGCDGVIEKDPFNNNNNNNNSNSNCPAEKMKCYGSPEKGAVVCTCDDLWDCSKNPSKCDTDTPVPPGGGNWSCTWVSEYKYVCKAKGDKASPPAGGSDWYCQWVGQEFSWSCTKVTTPVPPGSGSWKCKVDNELKKLVCEKQGSDTPPTGSGTWTCKTVNGVKVCEKQDSNGGMPTGGTNWKCNLTNKNGTLTWVCYGTTPSDGTPPGGSGWTCVKVKSEVGKDTWKCEKPDGTGDYPPGGGWWACTKGTEFSGTKCTQVPTKPVPPTPTPTPGAVCKPGTKMWCDGLLYCGWGQVLCKADGTWDTTVVDGKTVLNCKELADGRRPNTVCACYHFYYNASCCERPDCIVPDGTSGQLCPASSGKLCDYCNPLKPYCVETGAKCIVTNAHETFCGKVCASTSDCPSGYSCMTVKLKTGSTSQCVPADLSCYY